MTEPRCRLHLNMFYSPSPGWWVYHTHWKYYTKYPL